MPKIPPLWTVHVVLHAEDRVELRADMDGHSVDSGRARQLPITAALDQLEALLGGAEGAHIVVVVRAPRGPWRQMATRRWRVALYFILGEYERTFAGSRTSTGGAGGHATASGGGSAKAADAQPTPARTSAESPSVGVESGIVGAAAQQVDARPSKRDRNDR